MTNTQEEALANPKMATLGDTETQSTPSLIALALETASLTRSFLELLILELRLALQAIPRIIGLTVIALLLTVFAWLSFAATVAWVSATVLNSTGWGIAAFLVLQLIALFVCMKLMRRYLQRLSLPNSRHFLKQLEDTFNDPAK
jgi:hypothetical protein